MSLWTKRCVTAGMLVAGVWILGPGTAAPQGVHRAVANLAISAPATAACDNGGMIGSGTITC